ncbi:hypothetical protein [Aquitalea magnusonii]|uniref:hypothetical protein n=1 Tax=Aquitalea magnusonii TaxID=332411 RepID=UPI000E65CFE9|nr:hypothetical protein [Aquitalea magnusonii]
MMATPNSDYYPRVAPNPGQAVYLDGWETTLTAEWVGTGTPQLANWINLDTILLQFPNSYANLVFEWVVDGVTYRQPGVAYAMEGHVYAEKVGRGMATNAVSFDDASKPIPNGARVYLPLMAEDIQFLVNFSPVLLPYKVQDNAWVSATTHYFQAPYSPNGVRYVFPEIAEGDKALVLLCAFTSRGYVVIQEQKLTGELNWFDMPAIINNGGGTPS